MAFVIRVMWGVIDFTLGDSNFIWRYDITLLWKPSFLWTKTISPSYCSLDVSTRRSAVFIPHYKLWGVELKGIIARCLNETSPLLHVFRSGYQFRKWDVSKRFISLVAITIAMSITVRYSSGCYPVSVQNGSEFSSWLGSECANHMTSSFSKHP